MSSSPTLKVLVFAASLRTESLNRKLAALAARVAEKNGATVDLASMRDFNVSSYDGDVEASRGIPSGAKELQRRLLESDAFVISSPESQRLHARCPQEPDRLDLQVPPSAFRRTPWSPALRVAISGRRQQRLMGVADAA